MSKTDEFELDQLSRRLIAELQKDGRASFREIGKRLGVSPATARSRYNELHEAGVVEVIAVPNPWRMGLHFHATVGLKLKPGCMEEAVELLSQQRQVGWIGLLINDYDVMFEVAMEDDRAFGAYREELWSRIPGFIEADVYKMWDVRKFRYDFSLAVDDQAAAPKPRRARSSSSGGTK
ncbi:AsnC family transcriptional regulator [Methyloligella sp. 2.7D]|uniref:Lrp/AsnC family transcriptional regulator n=1 Tax=unclassified Methyloligella TaxID=2625955 RepID=UPI00157D525B|nr:AsnC family transcriptional regulator [Methyloligella sp. GL2]QKP76003.1 AsnC family transcriptional regulator [Methyloligella sp. GL2]